MEVKTNTGSGSQSPDGKAINANTDTKVCIQIVG